MSIWGWYEEQYASKECPIEHTGTETSNRKAVTVQLPELAPQEGLLRWLSETG
jgi:hypothetical protein